MIVTGVTDTEALRVSHLLNCSLGSFPLKYLGLPISSDKLLAKDFAPTMAKVGNRVMPWRGRYKTQARKVALINSCLSSLPMFVMGFYLLTNGTHAGFDKHRGAFNWNAADNKHKYVWSSGTTFVDPRALGAGYYQYFSHEQMPDHQMMLEDHVHPGQTPLVKYPQGQILPFFHSYVCLRFRRFSVLEGPCQAQASVPRPSQVRGA